MKKLDSFELVSARALKHLDLLDTHEREEVDAYISGLTGQAKQRGINEAPIHQFINILARNAHDMFGAVLICSGLFGLCFGIGLLINIAGKDIATDTARYETTKVFKEKMAIQKKEYEERLSEKTKEYDDANLALRDAKAASAAIIDICKEKGL